jgi:hypothetical protein
MQTQMRPAINPAGTANANGLLRSSVGALEVWIGMTRTSIQSLDPAGEPDLPPENYSTRLPDMRPEPRNWQPVLAGE